MDNRSARTREFCARIERGLIPAVPVPFEESGKLNEAAQESYIGWMAKQPVAGVAVWVHTGRGLSLSRDQRRDVLAAWRRGLPREKVIVAGAGAAPYYAHDPSTYQRSAIQMAEDAAAGGADALLAHPPQVPDVVGHHRGLAAAGLPLILFYLYEAAGGISYTDDMLRELFSLDSVAGIKMATLDSVMRYQEVSRLVLAEFPERLLVTGEDRFLGYSFMRGARAALIGMGAACCGLQADMMRSWFAGDAANFVRLSASVDELAEATFVPPMEGYIQRMLMVLAEQGIIPDTATFDPWGPLLERGAERARIREMLKRIGA